MTMRWLVSRNLGRIQQKPASKDVARSVQASRLTRVASRSTSEPTRPASPFIAAIDRVQLDVGDHEAGAMLPGTFCKRSHGGTARCGTEGQHCFRCVALRVEGSCATFLLRLAQSKVSQSTVGEMGFAHNQKHLRATHPAPVTPRFQPGTVSEGSRTYEVRPVMWPVRGNIMYRKPDNSGTFIASVVSCEYSPQISCFSLPYLIAEHSVGFRGQPRRWQSHLRCTMGRSIAGQGLRSIILDMFKFS